MGSRQQVAALFAALAIGAACSKQTSSTASTAPTTTTPIVASGSASCAPSTSSPGGRISDPNGPYFHRVAVGQTTDGVRVTGVRHIIEHASVPDGVRAPDGRILIYYVDGDNGSVWVANYTSGTATPIAPIAINGVTRPSGVVDPDAFVADGRIRLAYLSTTFAASSTRAMCLAESTDGVNFSVISTALTTTEMWTDPSVARATSGLWLMAISSGTSTILARSNDGRAFTSGERLNFGGVPEITALDDGRLRLYVCSRGIESYVSSDDGRAWTREAVVIEPSGLTCDPSRVAGTDLFVYKTGY